MKKQYDLSEHYEGQLLGAVDPIVKKIGVDAFCAAVIQIVLPYEKEMREKGLLTTEAIEMLDEYHAEKRREEQGFE
jgi:hypothetical protein